MFENPRRGRQARNFTTNVPKIIDLKSSSEQIFSETCRWVPLVITPNCKYARRPNKFQKEAAQQVSPCKPLPFHILSMNLYMSWLVSKLLEL